MFVQVQVRGREGEGKKYIGTLLPPKAKFKYLP
jgi:hypothetical protein